jgi:tRNA G18 (ribose-2'-O)-methylase SpoU
MQKPCIELVLHDIRSAHNVGAILRSADGFAVSAVYIGGYTPYPSVSNDIRLPHIASKLTADIAKTALGAEKSVPIFLYENLEDLVTSKRKDNWCITCLEQTSSSTSLYDFKPPKKILLCVGNEVTGVEPWIITNSDVVIEIPMSGRKESFNVAIATSIALYEMRR